MINLLVRSRFNRIFAVFVAYMLLSSVTCAQTKLSEIESYLASLDGVKADFKQWDHNGKLTSGTLDLKKPGRIRMIYNAPSKMVILSDGETIFFIDNGTRDFSYSRVKNSPASFLLETEIDLQEDFDIKEFEEKEGKVFLTISKKGMSDIGTLTLVFRRTPRLELMNWIIVDVQNMRTVVRLENLTKGIKHPKGFFDPSPYLNKN